MTEDMLEGLYPTDEERLAFYEALDEMDAEEAGLPSPYGEDYAGPWAGEPQPGGDPELAGDGEDYGPWDDSYDGSEAAYGRIAAASGAAYATAAQVAAEDAEDGAILMLRPSDEARLARARERIEAGTYLPPPSSRPARGSGGRFTSTCGEPDDLGYCTAQYHRHGCDVVTEGAAAAGTAEEAAAWRDTLLRNPTSLDVTIAARAAGYALAGDPDPGEALGTWDDLLTGPVPGSADPELVSRVVAYMGLGGSSGPRRPLPEVDVSGWRQELGV
jgi:hypothetical protein